MVKVRYLGLSNPKAAFNELRPYRDRLIAMGMTYFPFSDDYKLIHAAIEALDAAAIHFTGDERFFHVGDTGRIGSRR